MQLCDNSLITLCLSLKMHGWLFWIKKGNCTFMLYYSKIVKLVKINVDNKLCKISVNY